MKLKVGRLAAALLVLTALSLTARGLAPVVP